MQKTIVTVSLMCLYAPVAVVACSSSSTSSGSSVSSIDPSKQAKSLSDAEKTQYCKDTSAYLLAQFAGNDSRKATCFSEAYASVIQRGAPKTDSELQASCKTAYDECMAKPAPTSTDDAGITDDSCARTTDFTNCTVTVGELNTCVQDIVVVYKAAFAKYETACSKLQLDGGGVDKSNTDDPASCKANEAKCPGLKR